MKLLRLKHECMYRPEMSLQELLLLSNRHGWLKICENISIESGKFEEMQ